MKHLLTYIILCISVATFGQAGTLDVTFGNAGTVITNLSYTGLDSEGLSDVVVQPDGKIIAVGYMDTLNGSNCFVVIRYNTDGRVDSSFGIGGVQTVCFDFNADASSVALQSNGKIIVAGNIHNPGQNFNTNFNFGLARLTNEGLLDPTFGPSGNGKFETDIPGDNGINTMALQHDGKIIVGGYTFNSVPKDYILARYDTNGILDPNFGNNGIVTTQLTPTNLNSVFSIAVQSDGKILATGAYSLDGNVDVSIVRYNINGTIDNTFGVNGFVFNDLAQKNEESIAVVTQPDGKIVISGNIYTQSNNKDIFIARYNSDGTIDNTFNGTGYNALDVGKESVSKIIRQPDGKFLICATTTISNIYNKYLICRYNQDGTIDSTFNNIGYITTDFNGGYNNCSSITLQPDGKILAVGSTSFGLDRYCSLARYFSGLYISLLEFSTTSTAPLIYPNPIQQTETLKYTLAENETISISLYDAFGKQVCEFVKKQPQTKGDHEQVLTMPENLPAGSYILKISSTRGEKNIKLVK